MLEGKLVSILKKLKNIIDSSDFKSINENKMRIKGGSDEHVLHNNTHILP